MAGEGMTPVELESAYQAGLDLIRRGEYFAAHEELENVWRAARADERDFFQGLVHVAVAWYQAGRGRRIGTERQLEKAIRRAWSRWARAPRCSTSRRLTAQLSDLRATRLSRPATSDLRLVH